MYHLVAPAAQFIPPTESFFYLLYEISVGRRLHHFHLCRTISFFFSIQQFCHFLVSSFFFFQKSSRSFRWIFLKKQKTIENELFDSKHRQPKSTFYILNDKVSKSMLCDRMGRGGVGLVVRVCPILRRWELETWWWLPTFFRKILLEKEQN